MSEENPFDRASCFSLVELENRTVLAARFRQDGA